MTTSANPPGYGAPLNEEYWEAAKSLSRKLVSIKGNLDDNERLVLRQVLLELFLSMQRTEGVGLLWNRRMDEVAGQYVEHLRVRDPEAADEAENDAEFWTPLETTISKKT